VKRTKKQGFGAGTRKKFEAVLRNSVEKDEDASKLAPKDRDLWKATGKKVSQKQLTKRIQMARGTGTRGSSACHIDCQSCIWN
jgi:hypothetical protein